MRHDSYLIAADAPRGSDRVATHTCARDRIA
jgi:hypothetical protein